MSGLRPYAAAPGRRAAQVAADLGVLVWAVVCAGAGWAVHGAVDALGDPGRRLAAGAGALQDSLSGAARAAGGLPLVGEGVARPLAGAGRSAGALVGAGADLAATASTAALVLGWSVALLPVAAVVVVWLPARLRFARRAGAAGLLLARAAAAGPAGQAAVAELLAVRALASQPLAALARVSSDPVGGVRRGDPAVVAALAAMERRSLGLPGR